jgi:hypothetical protein
MGVGGARDTAVDVTYSTKTDGGMGLGFGTGQMTTTTTNETTHYGAVSGEGLLMGVGGSGDSAIDITYSTKVEGELLI